MFLVHALAWQACHRPGNDLVECLNKEIAPLPEGLPQDYTDSYLEGLVPWEKYTVIGLGEATHGTKDFFELKQRLVRFMVEQHQCRVLAYEYSYRKSILVNDYIHHHVDCPGFIVSG